VRQVEGKSREICPKKAEIEADGELARLAVTRRSAWRRQHGRLVCVSGREPEYFEVPNTRFDGDGDTGQTKLEFADKG
jgi:hypothetical protein